MLCDDDHRAARLLARAAATGLLHRRTMHYLETVNGQMRQALTSRIVIEQAKGFLAGRYNLTPEAAFLLLRAYARPRQERLSNVAQAVIEGRIDVT
jgi:AmiR/NasT family two-component response regulator